MANGDDFRQSRSILRTQQFLLTMPAALLAGWYWFLGSTADFHVDEYTTWFVGLLNWNDFWTNRLKNGHMPLWFLLSGLLRRLTGESEAGLRAPAGIIYGLATVLPLLLVRAGISRRTAALAFALVALNQTALWAGLNARPSCILLLAGGLLLVGTELYRHHGGRWALGLVLAGSLMGVGSGAAFVGTALFFALFVGIHPAYGARRKSLLIALLSGPVIWIPVLCLLGANQEKYEAVQGSIRTLNPERYLGPLGELFLGNSRSVRLALALAFVGFMVAGAQRHQVGMAAAALFCGTWLTLTLAQLITGHSVLGHQRYFSPGLIGGLVAVAIGLVAVGESARHRLRTASATLRSAKRFLQGLVVASALGFTAWNSYAFVSGSGDGVRDMVRSLLARPAEPMILPEGAAFQYEFKRQGGKDRYAQSLLIPRVKDSNSSATANAMVGPYWQGNRMFYLVVYNNKPDPLDGVLSNPPKGWTASEKLKFGDTRSALMMRAENP